MPRTIADLAAGTLIYIDETESGVTTHVPYIYLGQDENGKARVLRKYMTGTRRMHSSSVASYNGCEMDVWLEDASAGFLSRFDAATRNALENTTIYYSDYNQSGDSSVQYLSIARKAFLLSYKEVGFGGDETGTSFLPALKTFYNTASDNTARIGKMTNESAVNWWLRSGSSASQFRGVNHSGAAGNYNASSLSYYARPALSFAAATSVSDEGADEIFLLPDGRRTWWDLAFKVSLGQTAQMPKQCRLFVPNTLTANSVMTAKVCNNYGDVAPTWVSCQNGAVAEFGTSKTAEHWELGVQVEAQAAHSGEAIGEPAMIVEFEGVGT